MLYRYSESDEMSARGVNVRDEGHKICIFITISVKSARFGGIFGSGERGIMRLTSHTSLALFFSSCAGGGKKVDRPLYGVHAYLPCVPS